MNSKEIIDLIRNEKHEEIKRFFQDLSERQKCTLIDEIAENNIEFFADLLEVTLENTRQSIQSVIIQHSLKKLRSLDVPETHSLSILQVIYLSLNCLPFSNLSLLAEYLLQEIQEGISSMWYELLPRILQLITRNGHLYFMTSDDLSFTGFNYRTKFVEKLIKSSDSWSGNIISNIAAMLKKGIPLTETERFQLFDKICLSMNKLGPGEVSTLAFRLFQASYHPKLFVGVCLTLDTYFRHYYWKKMKLSHEQQLTQNSVMEKFPETRFRQEEDVIISQIYHTMEYNFTERALTNALKEITLLPDLLLTPFMFEALIALTRINQSFSADHINDSDIFSKVIHTTIQKNYAEIEIFKSSFIIKSLLEEFPKALNVQKVMTQIIDDSKSGLEVLTPGLFGLAYSFLRNKKQQYELYNLSFIFLMNFLHRRPLYTKGVFEKLISLMINDTNSIYIEVLEKLVTSKVIQLTPKDYQDVLEKVFNDIPLMTPDSATNLMMISYYLLRKSVGTNIRDMYIAMLRRSISHSNVEMIKMSCYGCTLMLKQIKYDEVTKGANKYNLTAACLTGKFFSQMIANIDNMSPHDVLTLEIFGILTKAFSQNFDVKAIMYKGLKKAAGANSKVLPHIIDFIIPRFRSFVDTTGTHFTLKLDQVLEDNIEKIIVKDNVAIITELLVHCIVKADAEKIQIENVFLRDALTNGLDKVLHINFDQLQINAPFTETKLILATQFLQFIESFMTFAIWKATPSNNFIGKLLKLSDYYHACDEELKKLANPKAGSKRKKESWLKNLHNLESVWDLATVIRFLEIYYKLDTHGLTEDLIQQLQSNRKLKNRVLKTTVSILHGIRNEPSYLEIKFSKKAFEEVLNSAKISYDRLFHSNEELCCEETLILFDIFKESILTAKKVFESKFQKFLNDLPKDHDDDFEKNVCRIIAQLTGMITKLCESATKNNDEQEFTENTYETKILAVNVTIVEIFLPYLEAGHPFCLETYEFFFAVVTGFQMNAKSLGHIFKVLFLLRQKAKPLGDFYISTAVHISSEYGYLDQNYSSPVPTFELKALTKSTLEQASNYFLLLLKSHLDQNLFLLKKANSLIYRLTKIPGQQKFQQQILSQLKEIEKLSINLLTVVCKVMLPLTNANIQLGRVADNIWRVLIHLYTNGAKLAKIFSLHNATVADEIDFYGLKELCLASHHITRPISKFILHIEELSTVAASSDKLSGTQAAKKILKDARYIPKYVYWFEKFSVEIIMLSDKTRNDFKNYLHRGVYRDFRIKSEELRKAIQKEAQAIELESRNSAEDFENSENEGSIDEELSDDESTDCESVKSMKKVKKH